MLLIKYLIFTFMFVFSTFSSSQSADVYKNFSKIIIKVEEKEKFQTIIAYNEYYHLNPKTAGFKLIFNDEICIGKMVITQPSSFKFMCTSGYEAQGVYYPTKNAVDSFGKGIDSKGKKLSFRLVGAQNSLEKKRFHGLQKQANYRKSCCCSLRWMIKQNNIFVLL